MTVEELIARLREFPDSAEVRLDVDQDFTDALGFGDVDAVGLTGDGLTVILSTEGSPPVTGRCEPAGEDGR
jgi:hypothetical protein